MASSVLSSRSTLLGGMLFAVIIAFVYFIVGDLTGAIGYLAIVSAVLAVDDILIYRWIIGRGAKIFSEL